MKLKTENPDNGLKAITAFLRIEHIEPNRRSSYDYVFEHGQLWIVCRDGSQWSVVDEGGPLADKSGFGFEQVAVGEEGFWD